MWKDWVRNFSGCNNQLSIWRYLHSAKSVLDKVKYELSNLRSEEHRRRVDIVCVKLRMVQRQFCVNWRWLRSCWFENTVCACVPDCIASPSRGGGHSGTESSCKSGSHDAESVLAAGKPEGCKRVHNSEVLNRLGHTSEVLVHWRNAWREYDKAGGSAISAGRQHVYCGSNLLLQHEDKSSRRNASVSDSVDAMFNTIFVVVHDELQHWYLGLGSMAAVRQHNTELAFVGGVAHA